mgnify:CR=1 FL=1
MTAIETLKEELRRVQEAQGECVNEYGYVVPHCRYRYQILLRRAMDLKGSIDFMQDIYREGGEVGAKS